MKTENQNENIENFLKIRKEIRYTKEVGTSRGSQIVRLHKEVGLNEDTIKEVLSSKDNKEIEAFTLSLATITQENKQKFADVVQTATEQQKKELAESEA